MSFTSFEFLLFVTVVIIAYYLVPKKYQWFLLLLASYAFYLSSGLAHVVYILGTTVFTYGAGRYMQKLRDDFQLQLESMDSSVTKEEKRALKSKVNARIHTIQVATVIANLSVLAYVKYLGFFIEKLDGLFAVIAWDVPISMPNILVPLGISYYTFNSIGYLIDIGRGKLVAERHLGKFALFVSFFPSIVQGPLFRYEDVGNQLKESHALEYNNLKFGVQLVLWGFFKKLVIADRLAIIASAIFHVDYRVYSGAEVFLGVLAYSFQIYGDFSGGVDITRGIAQMMGINLPLNFERPFFATSMADFWRRWHMSLGAWMRNYVFYPVMLSKPVTAISKKFRKRFGAYAGKIVPSVITPMVVFFLMNIWHGISTQRIVNALYNALLISSTVALTPVYKKIPEKLHINTETFSYRLFQMLRTFALLCVSRIITKAPRLKEALRMLKLLVADRVFLTPYGLDFITGINGDLYSYGVNQRELFVVFLSIMVLLVVGILQESGVKIRESLAKQNLIFRWSMILLLIATILVFGVYGPGFDAKTFIYGGF